MLARFRVYSAKIPVKEAVCGVGFDSLQQVLDRLLEAFPALRYEAKKMQRLSREIARLIYHFQANRFGLVQMTKIEFFLRFPQGMTATRRVAQQKIADLANYSRHK